MKKLINRLISLFLVGLLLISAMSVTFAQEQASGSDLLWEQIGQLRDGILQRDTEAEEADFAAISDDVYALVEASGTAREDSLSANGDFIRWVDEETGMPCCYSPAHEAQKAGVADAEATSAEKISVEDLTDNTTLRGGHSDEVNIGLIQPFWESSSNYADYSFTSYSPYYLEQANSLAAATGGTVVRYAMENATADTIASVLQSCAFVIFDSHGGTDYSSGSDYTSQANSSYLWLHSGGDSIEDAQALLTEADYTASHTGAYSTYADVYYSDGDYCINGTVIANHMTADAPNNMLYMGICLGMATDGICAPLRSKGVEVVYGYSQSVSFSGEKEYMLSITESLMNDKNVAEAIQTAKINVGICDPDTSTDPAYPIVVSSEDSYPGQGNVDKAQTVNSTWRLLVPHTVTVTVTNPDYGTASVDAYHIITSPVSGYYPAVITVTEGEGTYTVDGTDIYVQTTEDISISITFAPKPKVRLSFSGIDCTYISGTADDVIILPNPDSACDGYEFVGWTEEQEETFEATPGMTPDYLLPGSSYVLPYTDTTLYALYTHIDHNGTPSADRYVLVTDEKMLEEAGSYLITLNPYYSSSAYVFNGGLVSPNVNQNDKTFSFADSDETAILSTGATDACAVQIAPIAGTETYSMRLQNGAGKYFGNLGSSATLNARATGAYPTNIQLVESSYSNPFVRISNAEGNATYYFCFYVHSTTSAYTEKFCFQSASNYQSGDGRYSVALFKKVDGVDGTLYYTGTAVSCDHANATQTVTAPTCTAAGFTTYLCPDCGYKWIVTGDPATGHSYVATVTAPTASEQGYTTHVCSVCNDTYVDTYTDPYGTDYQVTFVAMGLNVGTQTFNSFTGATLPTPEIIPEGYTFAGWSESELPTEVTTATPLTGTYKPTADTTLYAVYSRSEFAEGNGDYVKVTSTTAALSGKYLIVYEGKSIAFNAGLGTTVNALNVKTNYVTVTISDDRIATSTEVEAAAVTIAKVSGTSYYSIKLPCNKYMGSTGSSTGMNINASTVYQNSIVINSDGTVTIANTSGTNIYNFVYSSATTSDRFAFYKTTNSTSKAVCLYQKDNGTTVYYYTTAPDVSSCTHTSYTTAVTAPTCTAVGYTTYTCTNCATTWTDNEVEALGHQFDEGVVTAPTQEAYGYTTYTCLREGCGYSYQDNFTGIDYELTFNILGKEQTAIVNGYTGTDLPTEAKTVSGYTFVGWSENTVDPENTEATVLTGHYQPTEDAILFAVYSRTAEEVTYYTTAPERFEISSAALVLNGKIDVAYTTQISSGYTDPRMVFSGPNGEVTVTDYTLSDDGCIFTYTGITPQCIGDNISATLYATKNGTETTISVETYSVRQYCINKLADETISASLRTLLSDLLAYGAAAQTYTEYKADSLVTAGEDILNPTYSTYAALSGLTASFEGTAAEETYWAAATLTLRNSVSMTFRFHAESTEGLSVKVYLGDTETAFTEFNPVSGSENTYEVTLTGIMATEFGENVTAAFYRDGAQEGNTVSYSVNTYVCSKQADGDAALVSLVKALYNYGVSAKAFAAET